MRRARVPVVHGGAEEGRRGRLRRRACAVCRGRGNRRSHAQSRCRGAVPSRRGPRAAAAAADRGGPGAPRRGVGRRSSAARSARSWRASSTAACSAPVTTSSTCGARRSGPRRSPRGARRIPTWCRSAASVWSGARSCCSCTARGTKRPARRAARASGCPAEFADAGAAFYQHAELCRVRGEFALADEAYRQANRAGRRPQPGLAMLRLAQGDLSAADAAIRSALHETGRRGPARGVQAAVEILLAAGDLAAARAAAGELDGICRRAGAAVLRAAAAQAAGAVALADGEPARRQVSCAGVGAVARRAGAIRSGARPGAHRMRLRRPGRRGRGADGARRRRRSRSSNSVRVPDPERVTALLSSGAVPPSGGLTGREVEVLRLIAAGKTNRALPTSWTSARRRSPATSATSSPSWTCRPGRPRLPTPTSTSWYDLDG